MGMCVHIRRFSALLVSDGWAMREPLNVGRATAQSHVFYFIWLISKIKSTSVSGFGREYFFDKCCNLFEDCDTKKKNEMEETPHIVLPQWLDELIFNEMDAKYHRYNSDMVVIEWDKSDILNYLGTYFPRSYAESYCIFSNYFSKNQDLKNKENLSIFDFGCGMGD